MKRNAIRLVLGCLLVALAVLPAQTSGFSIYEHSAKASGQAGAWVARADDAAANWYNPAALVRLEGMQVQFGFNLITIGSDTDFTIDDPSWSLFSSVLANTPAPTGTKYDHVQNNVTPIHLYFTHNVNGRIAWGIGINTPMGLVTEWADIPITFSHRRAELHTFAVNPNFAFALNDYWSLAVGVTYMYADVREFSRLEGVNWPPLDPNPDYDVVGQVDLTGDGTDWGWNFALLYASDRWNFGLTYRSETSPEIEGTLTPSGFEAMGPFAPQPVGGRTTLDLPAQAALGIAYTGLDRWEFEFDISWAGWSSFQALDIRTDDGDQIFLLEDWDDTYAFRLGAAWRLAQRHELRFGALWDKAPVPTNTLRPSIPDADRSAVSVGYGFLAKRWNLDFYYMPLFFDDITAQGDPDGKPFLFTPAPVPNPDPDAVDGVIDGTYSSFVHLLGVTFNFKF